ncbi:MAG: release factor glutamine methyltransferase [Alteromonadaceae bacterium]
MDFLKPDGWLMIEHGFEQGQKVREVFVQQGFVRVMTKKDYSGHERFTIGSYQTHR